MKDPQRLLIGDGSPLERELLRSVLDEPVPPVLHARMLAALPLYDGALNPGFDPTTAGSAGASGNSTGAAVGQLSSAGKVGLAKVASGGALKTVLVSLGMGTALTAGWLVTQPTSSVSKTSPTSTAHPAALVAHVDRPIAPTPAVAPLVEESASAVVPVTQAVQEQAVQEQAPQGRPPALVQASGHARRSSKPRVSTSSTTAVAQIASVASQSSSPSAPRSPTLVAELKLLDAARAAIQRGDTDRSLQVLDTYARQFPQGELAHEASVLRGLAQHHSE